MLPRDTSITAPDALAALARRLQSVADGALTAAPTVRQWCGEAAAALLRDQGEVAQCPELVEALNGTLHCILRAGHHGHCMASLVSAGAYIREAAASAEGEIAARNRFIKASVRFMDFAETLGNAVTNSVEYRELLAAADELPDAPEGK